MERQFIQPPVKMDAYKYTMTHSFFPDVIHLWSNLRTVSYVHADIVDNLLNDNIFSMHHCAIYSYIAS